MIKVKKIRLIKIKGEPQTSYRDINVNDTVEGLLFSDVIYPQVPTLRRPFVIERCDGGVSFNVGLVQEIISANTFRASNSTYVWEVLDCHINTGYTYHVENKNGVLTYSNSFEVNKNISLIRLKSLDTKENSYEDDKSVMSMIKKLFLKDMEVIQSYFPANNFSITVLDLPIEIFINSTNDLIFELIENAKIRVSLYPKLG